MTQLDVPTISFRHYLDLLRRRTWHVVSVSVLGLIVGGIVALMVPRYYVASTVVHLTRPILDPARGNPKDPMSQLVTEAKITVPDGVERAVAKLGWPEGLAGSEEDQRSYYATLKKNISVQDVGPSGPGRTFTLLKISYRDLNGPRSAAMANELRRQWLEEVVGGLEQKADAEVLSVRLRKRNKQKEKQRIAAKIRAFEEANGLNPQDYLDGFGPRINKSSVTSQRDQIEREIEDEKAELKGLDRKIKSRDADLDGISRTKPASIDDPGTNPEIRRQKALLVADISYLQKMTVALKSAHPSYGSVRRSLRLAQEQLAELEARVGGSAADLPNPEYQSVSKEVRELKSDRRTRFDKIVDLELRLKKLKKRLSDLPGIYEDYNELRAQLEEYERDEAAVAKELTEKEKLLTLIEPYHVLRDARQPPTPTDPNPYLVALMGCLVGLGVAVGLIFLFDFLQMSFKSVSEVESSLGLPVLGTLSFLETEEEVDLSRDRRRIVMIFAILFLVLVFAIVTIYFVDKTKLPSVVSGLLDTILGNPGTR